MCWSSKKLQLNQQTVKLNQNTSTFICLHIRYCSMQNESLVKWTSVHQTIKLIENGVTGNMIMKRAQHQKRIAMRQSEPALYLIQYPEQYPYSIWRINGGKPRCITCSHRLLSNVAYALKFISQSYP
jgi:hypothetical protein